MTIAATATSEIPADVDRVWDHVTHDLAELMAMLLLTTAGDRIVIGAGVALGRPALLPRIHAATADRLGDYLYGCGAEDLQKRIRFAGLGADAGPLGGTALALAALETRPSYPAPAA
jgi:fructokinase